MKSLISSVTITKLLESATVTSKDIILDVRVSVLNIVVAYAVNLNFCPDTGVNSPLLKIISLILYDNDLIEVFIPVTVSIVFPLAVNTNAAGLPVILFVTVKLARTSDTPPI